MPFLPSASGAGHDEGERVRVWPYLLLLCSPFAHWPAISADLGDLCKRSVRYFTFLVCLP